MKWTGMNAVAHIAVSAAVAFGAVAAAEPAVVEYIPAIAALVSLSALGILLGPVRAGKPLKPADWVSSLRYLLASSVPFLVYTLPYPLTAAFLAGTTATVLDYFDGALARRYGPTSFGALLDVEADAVLMQTGSITAVVLLGAPPVVLLLGAWRYIYVLTQLVLPPLTAVPHWMQLPMKIIGVASVFGLGFWYVSFIPRPWAAVLLYITVVLNTMSFFATWLLHLRQQLQKGGSHASS